MHRFHLPAPQCQGDEFVLTDAEAHHASDVLRVRVGDVVYVLDGEGSEIRCGVVAVSKRTVQLRVEDRQTSPKPATEVTLVQAVPKGKLLETIIQKATELGASRIIPLLSERVIVQLDADGAEAKAEKWQHVALEATKQCGQRWLPKVEAPISLPEFLTRGERPDLSLVGSLRNDARHPKTYFEAYRKEFQKNPASVQIWIGPEGDFTDGELEQIRGAGAKPIGLGPLVLRSDTAALYALSVVSYELQS